jgi:hypothetical protein
VITPSPNALNVYQNERTSSQQERKERIKCLKPEKGTFNKISKGKKRVWNIVGNLIC